MAIEHSLHNQPPSQRRRPLPFFVPMFNPLARRLVKAGLMGPNVLLTVRGRKSGLARSTPVAMVALGGRRWIIGTFGAVPWVQNLRAAGEATITAKGKQEAVVASELSGPDAATFFRDVLAPYVRSLLIGPLLLRALGAGNILADPDRAAVDHPVFELTPR